MDDVDEELCTLKDMKQKLLVEANNLIETLKKQEEDNQHVTLKLSGTTNRHMNVKEKLSEKNEHEIHEVSRQISGITFQDTDREWLHDNVYMYKTLLITKVLKFYVNLTVKLQGEIKFEIQDITCHFIDINKCYMLEIQSWLQMITRRRNFSFLTSAISQYTQQCIDRKKVIKHLISRKCITYNECIDGNGGIMIFLHAPENAELTYLNLQWSLIFSEQTWQTEHHFEIKATEAGLAFEEENTELLSQFCNFSITKEALVELWTKLCSAVDSYGTKRASEIDGHDVQ